MIKTFKPPWTPRKHGYTIRFEQTGRQLAHAVVSSKLNNKYLQPHYPLADNIISHSVTLPVILQIYDQYKQYGVFRSYLQTNYYDLDKVFTVTEGPTGKTCEYRIIYRNDHQVMDYHGSNQTTLEYIGENRYLLDTDTFQVKKKYHHERQAALYILEDQHFRIELEVLLIGIDSYQNRKKMLTLQESVASDPAFFGSCSFRFIVKDTIFREELIEHIDRLQTILSL